MPRNSRRILLLALSLAAFGSRASLAACVYPTTPAKIIYPTDGAVLNELTVTVEFQTVGASWVYRLDGKPVGWARAENGFQTLFNLSPGASAPTAVWRTSV